jgi:hypothetical protein
LAYRIVTLLIAPVGAVYYFSSRREIDQALKGGKGSAKTGTDASSEVPSANEASADGPSEKTPTPSGPTSLPESKST